MADVDFQKRKVLCLSSADNSIKGSIDEGIRHVVDFINAKEEYFTCSSCSGRIVVLCDDRETSVRKKGCRWLLTTHDELEAGELVKAASTEKANAVLKYEPFILHVQCRDLQSAQNLHTVAIESGFRNSGLTVGKRGKFTLAVRCTPGLQVPLSNDGVLLVTEEYLRFLTSKANEKMAENKLRIERFHMALQKLTRLLIAGSHWNNSFLNVFRKMYTNTDSEHVAKHVHEGFFQYGFVKVNLLLPRRELPRIDPHLT